MMSKTQWFVLLCCFVCYLLFGASVFYAVESKEEKLRLEREFEAKVAIEDLLFKYYEVGKNHTLHEIFFKISSYCDKPLGNFKPNVMMNFEWTFYHSVFYVMTIVSTIGYGNLSPSTPFTKTFMILYGLIGIPINGMVFITLGSFFAKTFLRLYKKLKNSRIESIFVTLGLVGQLILYISVGIALFIFVPSIFIVLYEKWTFDVAIEFTFGTLTTIGAGRTIPGTLQKDYSDFTFTMYRIFLLLWILIGLGYVAMLFGFITRALNSKKIHAWEHKLAVNIKKTNRKIRQELRTMLNEYLLMRIKRVYTEKHNHPILLRKSKSCPDFRCDKTVIKVRKRAFSECNMKDSNKLSRIQSDSELEKIDKLRTFSITLEEDETDKFIMRVASALGNYDDGDERSDEYYDSIMENRSAVKNAMQSEMRPRAASESKTDKPTAIINMPWYTSSKTRRMLEVKEQQKYGKARSRTLPPIAKPYQLIKKLRSSFKSDKNPNSADIESQTTLEPKMEPLDCILKNTSIADFIDALTTINLQTSSADKVRHSSIAVTQRKSSMLVSPPGAVRNRRFSICQSKISEKETTELKGIRKLDDFKIERSTKEKKARPKRISFQDFKND